MPRLRYEVRLEVAETRHTRVGHPCGSKREAVIVVCTSLEKVAEAILERSREGEICDLRINTI